MSKHRKYLELGFCAKCEEPTQLGETCCNKGAFDAEGTLWTRTMLIVQDAADDLACDCSDCMTSDEGPCEFDCTLTNREQECVGCKEAREAREQIEFETRMTYGF